MDFKGKLLLSSELDSVAFSNEAVANYERLSSLPREQRRVASDEFQKEKELELLVSVQIAKDIIGIKEVISRPCNGIEWSSKCQDMCIKILEPAIHVLPSRFQDANLRAWFYLQLIFCLNGNGQDVGLSNVQIEKILYLHNRMINDMDFASVHNLYISYYESFFDEWFDKNDQYTYLIKLREEINAGIVGIKNKRKESSEEAVSLSFKNNEQ